MPDAETRQLESEFIVRRRLAYNPGVDEPADNHVPGADEAAHYDEPVATILQTDASDEGHPWNLISSLIEGAGSNGNTLNHAPVIDIDVPCELVPSSQIGHYHLYIHKEISWLQYRDILRALAVCGIVERGFYSASVNRGYSSVRPIGRTKPGLKFRYKNALAALAETLHSNFLLRRKNQKLEEGLRLALAELEVMKEQHPEEAIPLSDIIRITNQPRLVDVTDS
jgi:hypothetical protein